jgi:hypothetical protein
VEKMNLTVIIPLNDINESTVELKDTILRACRSGMQLIVVINSANIIKREKIASFLDEIKVANLQVLDTSIESPGVARNMGLDACTTQYVTFWDSDDLPAISPTCNLLKQLEQAPKKKYGVGSFEIIDAKTKKLLSRHQVNEEWNLKNEVIKTPGIWRWIFKSDSLMDVRFQSFSMGEDQDFLADLNPNIHYAILSEEVTYIYVTGWSKQLTKNQGAVDEIISSISYLATKIFTQSANVWHAKFLFRQILTAMKRASWKKKMQAFSFSLRILWHYVR